MRLFYGRGAVRWAYRNLPLTPYTTRMLSAPWEPWLRGSSGAELLGLTPS